MGFITTIKIQPTYSTALCSTALHTETLAVKPSNFELMAFFVNAIILSANVLNAHKLVQDNQALIKQLLLNILKQGSAHAIDEDNSYGAQPNNEGNSHGVARSSDEGVNQSGSAQSLAFVITLLLLAGTLCLGASGLMAHYIGFHLENALHKRGIKGLSRASFTFLYQGTKKKIINISSLAIACNQITAIVGKTVREKLHFLIVFVV